MRNYWHFLPRVVIYGECADIRKHIVGAITSRFRVSVSKVAVSVLVSQRKVSSVYRQIVRKIY